MKIERFILGQLETNCYLVYDENCLEGIVIDPGDEGDFVSQKILDLGIDIQSIIATHGHFDHVLAALELKLNFNIPLLMHKADLPILVRMQESARHFIGLKVDPPAQVDQFLKEGDLIKFGKEKLEVIETPGHTPGSICLYGQQTLQTSGKNCHAEFISASKILNQVQDDKREMMPVVFSGDTLFCRGVGRTDFPYSSAKQLIGSLKSKLFVLPANTCVCPGHGEETTIREENTLSLSF